jgi:hypothetical protein
MRSAIWLALALTAMATQPVTANTIYRCPGSAGEAAFSDLPCPGGRVQATQPTTTVDMGVNAEEQAVLDRLDRRRPADSTRHDSNDGSSVRAADRDARRCAAAEAALDRIHAKKRSGYRASSAAALDARQRDAQAKRDRDCSR